MAEKDDPQARQKRFSRKDLSTMSTREFYAEASIPYKRLLGYVKPYKFRFGMGIFFGVIAGTSNAFILIVLKFVFAVVLDSGISTNTADVAAQSLAVAQKMEALATQLPNSGAEQALIQQVQAAKERAKIIAEAGKDSVDLNKNTALLHTLSNQIAHDPNVSPELRHQFEEIHHQTQQINRLAEHVQPNQEAGIRPFSKMPPPLKDVVIHPPKLGSGYQWLWVGGVCAIVPLMILFRGMLGYMHQYFMLWVGLKVLWRLRDELFGNLLRQSLKFYSRAKTGELMQTVFNQTRMAQMAGTTLASDLIKHPISILSIIGVLLLLDWKYTLAALVVFPACLLPVMFVSKKVRQAGAKEEDEADSLMVTMQETFAGIRVVKSNAREDHELKKFNDADTRMLALIMRWRKALEIVGPMVETVASVGIASGLVYAKLTHMSAGDFILLNMALMSMYPHAKALSRVQVDLNKCIVAVSKVFSLIDLEPEIKDAPDAVTIEKPRGKIQFHDVQFTYEKADRPAVKAINLKLHPGKNYALVGVSGSGKSTMLALLLRFYDPQRGSITLDGMDVKQITQRSLRRNIGIVNQELFLFHDTIYNNILYGDPNATKAQVYEAARRAYAHEFIIEKDGGYNAMVGDKGCMLSGGQQQRISIARAILRDAPILLLDEAYSALDSESEKKIHAAIEDFSKGKTVIAIAHRLSTILQADQIIVMQDGAIIGTGKHEELMETSVEYQKLYNLQFHGHLEPDEAIPV